LYFKRGRAFKYEICTKGAKPVYEEHLTGRSENDFHRLASFARLAEAMIAADHIAPNEQGFYCGGCPYQDACKTWHRDLLPATADMFCLMAGFWRDGSL